ncbi:hypothetical protein [Kocuria sp. LHG3120]|uniref:hypothetical protein n=1 Tax=Kocuria sp. LHG3120 TaxID=2804590 RepID=UPI003CF34256
MNRIDSAHLSQYLTKARRVLDATEIPCKPLDAVAASWSRYQEVDRNLAPLVAEAVLSDSKDLQTFHVLALAATNSGTVQDATVRNAVADIVYNEAHRAYQDVATEAWEAAAAMFNTTAARFTTAASLIDPEAPADQVVRVDNKQRTAWMDAANAAAELDQLTPLVLDAASLAGIPVGPAEREIPLVCNPGDAHRRRVYEAWATTNTNTRKWGALHALGVSIEAPEDLEDVKPYRQPKPMEMRMVHEGYGVRQFEVDPEDHDYQPQHTARRRAVVN